MSDQSEQVLLASYVKQRYLIILRGTILFSLSSLLLLFVVMSPGVQIMTNEYSWLPFVALLVLLLGGLEFVDAYVVRWTGQFFLNIQIAIMDTVIGVFMLAEMYDDPDRLTLLLSSYLIIKALFRIAVALKLNPPHKFWSILGSFVSLSLGGMIWAQWPFKSVFFIIIALCIDLILRGWSTMLFGFWLNRSLKQGKLWPPAVQD